MLNPLIDYELEMAHQHQAQLRRKAALWHLARRRARSVPRAGAMTAQSRPALLLSLLAVAQFVVVLDFSIVTIALPAIQTQFSLTSDDLQWMVSAYALTFAGCLLLGGRLADRLDRKRVFLGGLALFTVASLGGGLAPSALLVWVARGRICPGSIPTTEWRGVALGDDPGGWRAGLVPLEAPLIFTFG